MMKNIYATVKVGESRRSLELMCTQIDFCVGIHITKQIVMSHLHKFMKTRSRLFRDQSLK